MQITLKQAADLICEKQRFALTAHANPDGDALGSLLALSLALKFLQKEVSVLLVDPVPHLYRYLPGIDTVTPPRENEDTIRYDLLISLDSSDAERIAAVRTQLSSQIPVLNIDHHVSNTLFGEYNYIRDAAATGEIIFDLLREMQVAMTPDIATCLYTAIITDCGFFKYSNTTSHTHRITAELLDQGVRPDVVSDLLETKTIHNLKLLLTVLNTLETVHNGEIALLTLRASDLHHVGDENTEGFINYARYLEGVEVAIMLKEIDPSSVKVSMRSRSRIDVSRIALSFGGGGHKRAAGCTVLGTLSEVKKKVLQVVQQQWSD